MDFYKKVDMLAKKALTYEVLLSPKPGLVDRFDSGAHNDMDIYTFMDSIESLDNYLYECTKAGYEYKGANYYEILDIIRPLGIEAENRMLEATGGINTHKGAIFIFGILCAAIGNVKSSNKEINFKNISHTSSMIAYNILDDFKIVDSNNLTYGTSQFKNLGLTGIRGEVKDSFPSIKGSLIKFIDTIEEGFNEKIALGESLLYLMSILDDSNVIGRTGAEGLEYMRKSVNSIIEKGGYKTSCGLDLISKTNIDFINRRISPGGCADLASATLFIYWIVNSGFLEI